jgi:predicted alpha/beta-fold hydrolase
MSSSAPAAAHWPAFALAAAGHAYTAVPSVLHRLFPRPAPESVAWSTTLHDPEAGTVPLRGKLRIVGGASAGSDACLIVVHGLGGSCDAHYCVYAAWAAERAGLSCLRFGLRGADRNGDDFYHGGLAADLEAAACSPELAHFSRLYVIGYSLGGHMTLRYALAPNDARVRGVAALCSPLDLELSAQAIDHPRSAIYRHHVLAGLKEIYSAVARKRPVPTPLAEVLATSTIREWDRLTVVPRYGFGSVDNYYATMSAGPRLSELSLPALLVHSEFDPMVPPWTYEPHLLRNAPKLSVERVASGGHVGFPARVRFADGSSAALEDYVVGWLLQR